MSTGRRWIPRLVALLVLAPILAVAVIVTLLALGTTPHAVFLPGFAVLSFFERFGMKVPRAAGVVSTGIFWWGVIVLVWLLLRRVLRRTSESSTHSRRSRWK